MTGGVDTTIIAAFAVGFVSFISPCVLPLVPGYLSAVSAVEADRLGERGVAWRVVRGSLPFALGLTVVFVFLGAVAAALGQPGEGREPLAVRLQPGLDRGQRILAHCPPPLGLAPGLFSRAYRRRLDL